MKTLFTKGMLASAVAVALTQPAMAQEDVKQQAKDNAEIIVVSGTPGGAPACRPGAGYLPYLLAPDGARHPGPHSR